MIKIQSIIMVLLRVRIIWHDKKFHTIFFLLLSFNSSASCTLQGDIQSLSFEFLQNHLTIGNDRPVGYNLIGQNNQPQTENQTVNCTDFGQLFINRNYDPGFPLVATGLTGSYGGSIYQSKVNGLGFYYYSISQPLSASNTSTICPANSRSCTFTATQSFVGIRIVKTGNVVPGSILQGSDLPCAVISAGLPGDMVTVKKMCVNGTLIVENLTCTTPTNVDVWLGSYDVSKFSGIGTATKWVDASIHLTNCPPMQGIGISGNSYDDGTMAINNVNANSLALTLTPLNGVKDPANGVINLSTSASARGIGVQIGAGDISNPTLLNFESAVQNNISLPITSTSTEVTIPLNARYIQTDDTLLPGTADSQIIYMINYY